MTLVIGMFVLMAFALLLVLAHLGWLIGLWERLRPFGAEWPGAALCVLAALTPLLGFYATGLIDRLRGGTRAQARRPRGGAGLSCP